MLTVSLSRSDIWDKISEVDLSPILRRTCQRLGWDDAKARQLDWEYRAFLFLTVELSSLGVSPTSDIDEVWHDHILHTEKYAMDCDFMFGRFRHHHPHAPDDKRSIHPEAAARITSFLTEHFGLRGKNLALRLNTQFGAGGGSTRFSQCKNTRAVGRSFECGEDCKLAGCNDCKVEKCDIWKCTITKCS